MTQQVIVATPPGSGLGDPAYTAFAKVNSNFTDLYTQVAQLVFNVKTYGALGDGVTDDSTAINAAGTAAAAAGGGTVYFPPGLTYLIGSSLTLQSNVTLSWAGATLKYTGSGFAIVTPATGTTNNPGVLGGTIILTSASAGAMQINSAYHGQFRNIYVTSAALGTTNIIFKLGTNTTGTNNPAGNLNHVFCIYDSITVDCQFGTGLQLIGTDSNHVVTDNTFTNIVFEGGPSGGAVVYGIEFNQWCDTNVFPGFTLVRLYQTSPASGIGVGFGTGAGGGVYAECFQCLAVDVFGAPATDNRQGLIANNTLVKFITIGLFEYGPTQGLGGLPNIGQLLSSVINQAPRSITNYQSYQLTGSNVGMGIAVNPAVTCIAGQGAWLAGAAQYVYYAQGSCFNTASTLGVSYACVPGAAAAVGPYTVTTVRGFMTDVGVNGANATTTNFHGFFCADQSIGASTNVAFISNMNSGAGKFAFYGAGTANSQFGGGLGLFGNVAAAQITGWGTPVGNAVINNYNISDAGGANSNTNKVVAQCVATLKALGMWAA